MGGLCRIVNARTVESNALIDITINNGAVVAVESAGDKRLISHTEHIVAISGDHAGVQQPGTYTVRTGTSLAGDGSVPFCTITSSAEYPDQCVIDAEGRWIIPGLWDWHTHFTQWSKTLGRLDLIDAHSADEAMAMLRDYLNKQRDTGMLHPESFVVGMRFRHSLWSDDAQPTLTAIDAVSGDQPVALSSVDMHCGWVNSVAAHKLGVTVDSTGLIGEHEWFNVYQEFDRAPGMAEQTAQFVREAEIDAASKGVVGICDYEMADNITSWISRFADGIALLRVDVGVYPERLQQAINDGWNTGDVLPGSRGLGRVGAMKMISDGSLNTRSAYCSTPYSGIEPETYGVMSYTPEQIENYMRLATDNGFTIACHAIGDEANTIVLNKAAITHARGSIEHAQMLKPSDIPRFAEWGLAASVQPQHAVDDRDVIDRFWATPAGVPYAFRSLIDAGATLRIGSDAPVAPLDPWMSISAAVFGTASSNREPFQPEQCLDVRTALCASTETGRTWFTAGDAADLVLLDVNPYTVDSPEGMCSMSEHVVATMLAGRWTYRA